MKVHELQEYGVAKNEFWFKIIADITKQWDDKRIDEAYYQSQLSLCYSRIFKPVECKMHAALVPSWAAAQEKTEALVSVARVLVFEKKIEEALNNYQQAYVLNAEHEIIIEEAGWCCYELKQWEQAQDWFTKGTILMDDYETFWEGLGFSLAQQKKYEAALTAFKKAFELCNKQSDGYYYDHLIGECYANLNDFYRALGYYTKSLDAKPTHANALNDMAALYYNQEGDMSTAIDYLKKAEAIAEKDKNDYVLSRIYMNLARLYSKIKEFELHELYQTKLMEKLGFGGMFGFSSDDDEQP